MKDNGLLAMFGRVDWVAVLLYSALVLIGWVNIYAAVYDDPHDSIRLGMQLVWIGVSLFLGVTILLVDDKYYHMLAYPVYWIILMVLFVVAFAGTEVNGARSWIKLGPVALQPAEMMKFAVALALARYMSNYSFSITDRRNLLMIGLILALPIFAIVLQHDAGSALVYGSFIFMLYREGFNGWFYAVFITAILLFIFSFLLTPLTLLVLLVAGCALGVGFSLGRWRLAGGYLASVALGAILIYFGWNTLSDNDLSEYVSLLISVGLSLVPVIIYAYKAKLAHVLRYAAFLCAAILFTMTVDYVFNNVMEVHQQKRILDLLGLESDLKGWGYNVNQSKIAIGSGGFFGKGFLEGTQTKYNFVPEQSTDFIFCTVGEEWGFVGASVVLGLFLVLILRLMRMGERQHEAFGRVYCYSVASIFLMHVAVNIGMTIGLMPVIGIPLPFLSYGGSSMLAFTLLFFVAVKLDATKRETNVYRVI